MRYAQKVILSIGVGVSVRAAHPDYDQGKWSDAIVDALSVNEINAVKIENKARVRTGDHKRTHYGPFIIDPKLLEDAPENNQKKNVKK